MGSAQILHFEEAESNGIRKFNNIIIIRGQGRKP